MYAHPRLYTVIALLILAISIPSAAAQPDAVWPTEGWTVTAPEEQGMDSMRLADMFLAAEERGIALHSVVITRGGCLVAEAYRLPVTVNSRQNMYSVTKSITATLLGMAWDDGIIALDQPAADYFPAWVGDERAAITIEDMLTMQSGLDWLEGLMVLAMAASEDWVGFVVARPLETPPGTEFLYNSGTTHLLSAIVQIETGQTGETLAQEHVFGPLGITAEDYVWQTDPQGFTSGAWGLTMTARAAAKIGYLMLRDGVWEGKQLLSPEWIDRATTPYAQFDPDRSYGYQWWIFHAGGPDEYYAAAGAFGQMIMIMPSLDLVVVMTANEAGSRDQLPRLLFEEFVIPAVISDGPLDANPAGFKALADAIEAFEGAAVSD